VSGKHNKGWTGAYSSQVKPSVSIAKFGVAAKEIWKPNMPCKMMHPFAS